VGKTTLAIALDIPALEAVHRIRFIACHDLIGRFRRALRKDRVHRLLTTLLRPRQLISDETGSTPRERGEATCLFAVVTKRTTAPGQTSSTRSLGSREAVGRVPG